ncbi:MAG TPA: ABC transporter substrate-binding protein, partial [Acidimicrobiia bacterium]|nr:ABC transporter substrate-binding protein [Acidimicrobiia bacterium]
SAAVVATVGTYSGPVGTVLEPIVSGARLWVAMINQKGGLNGHPVKLLTYDDGADPARHRAQLQQAVEKDKAIAFLVNGEVITGRQSVDYIDSHGVPVVGGDGGEEWAYSSPLYFPQMSTGTSMYRGWIDSVAGQVVGRGLKRLGSAICVEAAECDTFDRVTHDEALARGLDHVYRARATITQPDYTAECLAARNAGVEVMYLILDQNSIGRFATSCARQGYRPLFAFPSQGVSDYQKDDPNLAGAVANAMTFPYFQTGTPATDEFQSALRAFGRQIRLGNGVSHGWTAGKLLEKAGARLPEPPSSAAILDGLWSIDRDTLGGLTLPLTFARNQPPTRASCWFDLTIAEHAWSSPDRYRLHCR